MLRSSGSSTFMNRSSSLLPVCGGEHCEAVGSRVCSSPSFLRDAHQTQQHLTWLFRWNVSSETHKCQEDIIIDIMLKRQSYRETSPPLLLVFVVRSALTLGAVSRIGGYIHTVRKKKKKEMLVLTLQRETQKWQNEVTQCWRHTTPRSHYYNICLPSQNLIPASCSVSLNEAQRVEVQVELLQVQKSTLGC